MKVKHYIALAALVTPLAAGAQSVIDFETESGYTSLGVYDTWENSPFVKGTMKGNVKVIANPYKQTDDLAGDTNMSEHVLAFQRSRFGSNTFGVDIALASPIALTNKTQYVHVKMYTPKSGRVMLFGLGSRDDRPEQSKKVVQVEAACMTQIKTNQWCDAVFAVSAAPGVTLHSLLIAPDVESPHDLSEDFAVYVDDIEINSSSMSRIQYGVYPINFEKTETLSRTDRYAKSITMKSSDGSQSIAVNQQSDKLMYQNYLASSMKAKAGETVKVGVVSAKDWMHNYVYIDRNNDGKFDCTIGDDNLPAANSDAMSYSYYKGKNSAGSNVGDNTQNLPDFKIPSELKPGVYRLRYKVDWDCIDAGGNSSENNAIKANGGAVIDTRLIVHEDQVSIQKGQNAEGTNGEILTVDGEPLDGKKIPFGKDYTIKFKPADKFKLTRFTIRHGYNLTGDSLVNETPQYIDEIIPAYMVKDLTYTIPAKYVDGDISILPWFSSESTNEKGNYPLNFDKTLKIDRSGKGERKLSSLSFTTTSAKKQTITIEDPTYVYQDYTNRGIYVKPGEAISTDAAYTLNNGYTYMHAYLYVDLDNDGTFSTTLNTNGTPAWDGEMLSYYYYNGHNSAGATMSNGNAGFSTSNSVPQFTLPVGLPLGKYRARFKIDWDDIDPAGRYSTAPGYANLINENGGYVIDFDFDVVNEIPKGKLDINTVDGSLVGLANTGVADSLLVGQSISLLAVPAADGYELNNGIVVRHGKNLKGKAVVNGETQWQEDVVTEHTNNVYTIPAKYVDGDVQITANFEKGSSALYNNVFDEEFDGEDGSQPNNAYWSRSGWAHPTWKRYTAQTKAGQEKTGWIEDGKLVLRCVKNTFNNETTHYTNGTANTKLEMISGAVETADKVTFTYGKVEGRIKNTGHSGNFPAFWMMPNESTYGGWPSSGEIDIWESIDAQNKSWHTIHTHWANGSADGGLGNSNKPAKSSTSVTQLGEYHVYGLEWTEDLLKWFVDGKQVFSYAKSTDQDALDKLQWPFDKPFYIILNQSVGNGSWAANRDLNFTYETKFDWVRVYQKQGGDIVTGIKETKQADFDFYTFPGKVRLVAAQPVNVQIVDLQGRVVYNQKVQGNVNVALSTGIYLINGKKVLVP